MKDLAKIVGQRIRSYRAQRGFSQEKLAELADYHPTYIGQLERGEKNATLESISRVAAALNIPLSTLLENLGITDSAEQNIPRECYDFLLTKTPKEQKRLFKILTEIDRYKED